MCCPGQELDGGVIDILAPDLEFLKAADVKVRIEADALLRKGLESHNQVDVGNALQVHFNLEELPSAMSSLVSRNVADMEHKAKLAFDLRHSLTGSAGPGGWQETLWSRIKDLVSEIETSTVGIWHLQQVIAKKRDPVTHVCFDDVLTEGGHDGVLAVYWEKMTHALKTVIGNVVHPSKSSGVRDALTKGFPALCTILETMFEKVMKQCQTKSNQVAFAEKHLEMLLASCQPIQSAYLARSLTRMSDSVNVAFPGGIRTLPSRSDVQKCIARMHEEVRASEGSLHASALIGATVGKVVNLIAERVDAMASAGSEVRTMSGPCTSAQARNISLCSHIQEIQRTLVSVAAKLPLIAAQSLLAPTDVLKRSSLTVVAPIFKAGMDSMEHAILEIHSTNNRWGDDTSSGTSSTTDLQTPAYIKELEARLANFRNEYLMKFTPVPTPMVPSLTTSLMQRMACRVLVYFTRHAALIRPMGLHGRQQLSRDLQSVQTAVSKFLFPVERLGSPFRALRSFQAMLETKTKNILSTPGLADIPKIVVLHHLYSRAPSSLASPHSRTGLSPSLYSLWLDSHAPEAAVDGVKAALEACAPKAKAQPGFDEVYSVMMSICEQ